MFRSSIFSQHVPQPFVYQVYAMFAPHSNTDSLKADDNNKVQEQTYGWFCHTGRGRDWDTSKSGEPLSPWLQLFGLIVDVYLIRKGCLALDDHDEHRRKENADASANVSRFSGLFLKGVGCLLWSCQPYNTKSMHGWCCEASFISMLFNFFSACAS